MVSLRAQAPPFFLSDDSSCNLISLATCTSTCINRISVASATPPMIKSASSWEMRLMVMQERQEVLKHKRKIRPFTYLRSSLYSQRDESSYGLPRLSKFDCVSRKLLEGQRRTCMPDMVGPPTRYHIRRNLPHQGVLCMEATSAKNCRRLRSKKMRKEHDSSQMPLFE